MADPFRHHPGLRDLIADPESSFFRDFTAEDFCAAIAKRGLPVPETTPDDVREAGRKALLSGCEGDLWIFAYGSLMWDPCVTFAEVRRAQAVDHARKFILKDTLGGRGTANAPGLMVALDTSPGTICNGLVFRIEADLVEAETARLWRRERLVPAYNEVWVSAETAQGVVRAATFRADHGSALIDTTLSFEEKVRYTATGSGFLGSSLDYIRGISKHFREMKIDDPEVARLLAAAELYRGG